MSFNHVTDPVVLSSEIAADNGQQTLDEVITDPSSTKSLAITGFEFYLGGNSVGGAASENPAAFLTAANGWTYSLGVGNYSNSDGTGWSGNPGPTNGAAVASVNSNKKDFISSASLYNTSNVAGNCYIGDILAPGATCDVELFVTPNYGGAQGSSSTTFIYGYAEGVEGTGTYTSGTQTWQRGSTDVGQGLVQSVDVEVTPEPTSLVLLGTGFGLLGLGAFLRRRHTAAAQSTTDQPTTA
jgi:hypothetical protein